MPNQTTPSARFAPRARRELAGMFDEVSGRYDFLNRVMSLGQDGAWRAAMWRAVPENARIVLDLCAGSGASLEGLRRPGRTVLGMDVSLGMLEVAAHHQDRAGWAPRLVCADAFRLPLRDASVDAVTIAFGMRNLRPRDEALAEIARILRPGGTLVVLEAAAPSSGPLAALHGFYLRRLVPLAGRLSSDPSAYAYLSRSIFEFGAGPEFERDLAAARFEIIEQYSFLFGATRLWLVRRAGSDAQIASNLPLDSQNAWSTPGRDRPARPRSGQADQEWRLWTGIQLALSVALFVAFVCGLYALFNFGPRLPLEPWQRQMAWALTAGGTVFFALRTVVLLARWKGPLPKP